MSSNDRLCSAKHEVSLSLSHTPRTKTNPVELDEGVYRDRRDRMVTPDFRCRKYLDVMIFGDWRDCLQAAKLALKAHSFILQC